MPKIKKEEQPGKINVAELRDMLNKKAGKELAFDLRQKNPTEVKNFIPTGSTILNAMLVRGKMSGVPVSKVLSIEGDPSSGKSYFAAQIAGNAQKMGYIAVYYDSESAIDPSFLSKAGCNLEELIYIQAENVEMVLESIEEFLGTRNKFCFVFDSVSNCPCKTDIEGDFDPQSTMAIKARVLSKGFTKLIQPIANTESVLLLLNQLKTNLSVRNPKYATESEKYIASGGKSIAYNSSIIIRLITKKAKDSFIYDEHGYKIGNEVCCKIEKSRFGTQGRECFLKIIWAGDKVGVKDEASIFTAIEPFLVKDGHSYKLCADDTEKFKEVDFERLMQNEDFRKKVMEIVEKEIVVKFDTRTGDAKYFYNINSEEECN